MSPYELVQVGGSVDHFNDEPGLTWLSRIRETFPHSVWLNPEPEGDWNFVESTRIVGALFEQRMFALTLNGLTAAMDLLRRRSAHRQTLLT
jgi:hypothetical protein